MKKILLLLSLVLSSSVNASIIDVIDVTASGTVEGGGPMNTSISRLFDIPENATVNSFTITLTQFSQSIPNLSLEVANRIRPYYGGRAEFINNPSSTNSTYKEVGAFITVDSQSPSSAGYLYTSLLGLVSSSGVPYPERISTYVTNTGQTTYHSAAFTISANGDFSPVPIPSAVWLFGSGLIGLVNLARRKKSV